MKINRKKKEEEAIERTHTNPYLYPNMSRKLSDEERRVFAVLEAVAKKRGGSDGSAHTC
jgi:hypothetical protein